MKKLSEIYKELGIAFSFPIKIKDANGKETYVESSKRDWRKREYDANGRVTYFEESKGFWSKREYNSDGEVTYYVNSDGYKEGTPKSATCEGKVIEVDGIKYELKAL